MAKSGKIAALAIENHIRKGTVGGDLMAKSGKIAALAIGNHIRKGTVDGDYMAKSGKNCCFSHRKASQKSTCNQ